MRVSRIANKQGNSSSDGLLRLQADSVWAYAPGGCRWAGAHVLGGASTHACLCPRRVALPACITITSHHVRDGWQAAKAAAPCMPPPRMHAAPDARADVQALSAGLQSDSAVIRDKVGLRSMRL